DLRRRALLPPRVPRRRGRPAPHDRRLPLAVAGPPRRALLELSAARRPAPRIGSKRPASGGFAPRLAPPRATAGAEIDGTLRALCAQGQGQRQPNDSPPGGLMQKAALARRGNADSIPWHSLPAREVIDRVRSAEGGLDEGEAARRLREVGPNEL